MELSTQKLSKAFNQKYIFKDLSFSVKSGSRFAIAGPNGSGKSTLLKILSGGSLPSSGTISYQLRGNTIPADTIYKYVHFVAPYNTVIEELTLNEIFRHHKKLGLLSAYDNVSSWLQRLEYPFNPEQQIKKFSSGMKQRIRLGLTLLDDRPLIFLDEPGSNLDMKGKEWLASLIMNKNQEQSVIIATNEPSEIAWCEDHIHVGEAG